MGSTELKYFVYFVQNSTVETDNHIFLHKLYKQVYKVYIMIRIIYVYTNTNTNTNVFISNQGPIKGKIITMIKYMGTMCNVYTQYNVTIK